MRCATRLRAASRRASAAASSGVMTPRPADACTSRLRCTGRVGEGGMWGDSSGVMVPRPADACTSRLRCTGSGGGGRRAEKHSITHPMKPVTPAWFAMRMKCGESIISEGQAVTKRPELRYGTSRCKSCKWGFCPAAPARPSVRPPPHTLAASAADACAPAPMSVRPLAAPTRPTVGPACPPTAARGCCVHTSVGCGMYAFSACVCVCPNKWPK